SAESSGRRAPALVARDACPFSRILRGMASPRSERGAFRALGEFVRSAAASGLIPGAVVAVGRASGLLYHEAIGRRALRPRSEPMTLRTIFDLASLTKVLVVAPLLVEEATR